jgi:hypothetical protein
MKLLAIIMVFMIAAQPLGAGFCDMEASDGTADHAGMLHHGSGQEMDSPGSHDCCDPDRDGASEPASDCSYSMDCGFCASGVTALTPVPYLADARLPGYRPAAKSGIRVTRQISPPFRPPISAS